MNRLYVHQSTKFKRNINYSIRFLAIRTQICNHQYFNARLFTELFVQYEGGWCKYKIKSNRICIRTVLFKDYRRSSALTVFPRHRFAKFFPYISYTSMWRMTAWNFIWQDHARGTSGTSKSYPSLFLSARGKCRVPRVPMRVSNDGVDAPRNFSRGVYRYIPLGTRTFLTLHNIRELQEPMKNPHRSAAPIHPLGISTARRVVAHSARLTLDYINT